MADSIPADLWIGGDLPVDHVSDLLAAIESDGAEIMDEDGPRETLWGLVRDPRDMLTAQGLLHLHDGSARNGEFMMVEEFLQAHDITYDRVTEAYFDWEGERVQFRPSLRESIHRGVVTTAATNNGESYTTNEQLHPVLRLLNDQQYDKARERLAELLWAPERLMPLRLVP